ncbi:hypothetical protein SBOR_7683 [Sclerotinia borealis F-4128]|uniref:Uncharacterized protein n=1 Tax=Sclerotinia borealis (strain F-4128) TaxID=1432307 RepID=W9C826_SCLBF|nr:hypothetical protein SBOR_7683 [Sclerotinia borealis F-4128]
MPKSSERAWLAYHIEALFHKPTHGTGPAVPVPYDVVTSRGGPIIPMANNTLEAMTTMQTIMFEAFDE